MHELANIMRMHAESITSGNQNYMTIMGTVSGYDPNYYCATVTLQPDGTETGWMPIMTPWVGNSWGLFCPPNIGDQVEVQFQEGNINAGIVCLRAYSQVNQPLSVNSGEFWLVHSTGSFIKLTNDGNLSINGNENINISINTNNSGKINLNGNVNVTGNIVASGDITDKKSSMETIRTDYNEHTHPPASDVPSPQMPV